MKNGFIGLFLTMFTAFGAQAEGQRVLVVLKSPAQFQAAQQALQNGGRNQGATMSNPGNANLRYAAIRGRVEKSLRRINTLVLKVESAQDVQRLKENPDVAYVEKEVFHPAPAPVAGWDINANLRKRVNAIPASLKGNDKELMEPTPQTPWGILAVKAFGAWPTAHRGETARVLVLDTGIDKDHESLSANFEKGQDFVGDGLQPYPYIDTQGHGTHVSGTIAAVANDDGFTGVAPQARLLMGRVCAPNGCSNVSIAQGINWGIEEKVDVISMSLGGMWSTPAEREAISTAIQSGITVVAAAGNDGTNRVGFPAALPNVIAVGAVDSKLQKAAFSQYGPELSVVAPGVAVLSSVPRGSGRESKVEVMIGEGAAYKRIISTTFDGAADVPEALTNNLVFAGLGKPEDFAALDVAGKFVLVSRGEIKFSEKAANAIAAGATGMLVYNNEAGLIHGSLTQDGSKLPLAVFMTDQEAGESLRAALANQQKVQAKVAIVKTDYSPLDGTSMATPHVAGVIALMKAANHSLSAIQVKQILQQTASALAPNTNNEFGFGLVNADEAVRTALLTTGIPMPPVAVTPAPAPTPVPQLPGDLLPGIP